MLANTIASAWSDFARVTRRRSRYRAAESGLIACTGLPLARKHATNSPRGVSIATGMGAPGLSPARPYASGRER